MSVVKRNKFGFERKGIFDVKTVFDWVEIDSIDSPVDSKTEYKFKEFDGVDVISTLLGYKVFKFKGSDCCTCDVKGEYFALERTPGPGRSKFNNWHFNLYGKNKFGVEV